MQDVWNWKSQKKVLFHIASEASYVYILSGKSWLKMPKIVNFSEFLKNLSVTRQVNFN